MIKFRPIFLILSFLLSSTFSLAGKYEKLPSSTDTKNQVFTRLLKNTKLPDNHVINRAETTETVSSMLNTTSAFIDGKASRISNIEKLRENIECAFLDSMNFNYASKKETKKNISSAISSLKKIDKRENKIEKAPKYSENPVPTAKALLAILKEIKAENTSTSCLR